MFMRKERKFLTGILICLFIFAFTDGTALAAPKKTFLSFAGGPAAGSAVMDCAAAVAGLLNKKMPDLNVTPESSAGAAENVRRVQSRQADMGGAFSADMYEGYFGKGKFAGKPQQNIRGIGILYASFTHVVALKSSGIKTVFDLQGKKVAVGGQGMGTALLCERLFKELGMWDKIRVAYLGGNNSAQALKDGQIDAFVWSPGVPGPTIVDVSSVKDIVLIDVVGEAKKKGFFAKYPYYSDGEIPAGVYRGVNVVTPVITSSANWIVNKDTPANLVYEMTKIAYSEEGVKYLSNTYKPLKNMGDKKLILGGIKIPLHPGAEKYWKEKGMAIPDNIKAK
jgi:TRAP transporter TAXI family solute receptor